MTDPKPHQFTEADRRTHGLLTIKLRLSGYLSKLFASIQLANELPQATLRRLVIDEIARKTKGRKKSTRAPK